MFKEEKDNTQENGMFVNRYVCAKENIVSTAQPYDCDRPIKAIVEPIKDDSGYELGFSITEMMPLPRTRNKQIFRGPHITIRICKDDSFRGTIRFGTVTAKSSSALKRELTQALVAIQSYIPEE